MTDLTLLIDNYDSFTWNVYQYLAQLDANVLVKRNDAISLEEVIALNPTRIVISPGPGHPEDAGVSNHVIRHFSGKLPILGVCLGEQAMFSVFGGTVKFAGELVHGKTTPVWHDGKGLFDGVPQGIECTRYHSLAGDPTTLPDCLEVTSKTKSGIIMGVRHKEFTVEGVQFHPESVSSESGRRMFANFLSWQGGKWSGMSTRSDVFVTLERLITEDRKRAQANKSGIPLSQVSKLNSTNQESDVTHTSAKEPRLAASKEPSTEKPSILQQISRQRLLDVQDAQSLPGKSLSHLKRSIALGIAPRLISFYDRLKQDQLQDSSAKLAVISEVKRASPSKGDIALSAHAPSQALDYARGGASAISVLTEPTWFKGSLSDMLETRLALESLDPNSEARPAVLRKDFILDPYQVYEARLFGADSFLLIVAILTDTRLVELIELGRQLGMEPLVEVATEEEMQRAVKAGAKIIGINNRDLHTFQVDMNRTNRLSEVLQASNTSEDVILLALSGIKSVNDAQPYHDIGVTGVLVGEALMQAPDVRALIQSLKTLKNAPPDQAHKGGTGGVSPLIKMCGMTRLEDVQSAVSAGASLIGFVFAPESPRYIAPANAKGIIDAIRESHTSSQSLPLSPSFNEDNTPSTHFKRRFLDLDQKSKSQKPQFVGVFTNQTIAHINNVVQECGLDLVQFHDKVSRVSQAPLVKVPVIQAISLEVIEKDSHFLSNAIAEGVSYLLLDASSKDGSIKGGSGSTVDWKAAETILAQRGLDNGAFFLAGGLNPDNISIAVKILSPLGVDVSSGIEQSKGVKDVSLMKTFVSNISTI